MPRSAGNQLNIRAGVVEAEQSIVDSTQEEAFVVRKNNDGDDVLTVNTSASEVKINGNLDVQGSLTYVSSTAIDTEDELILLASNNIADTRDIGFFGLYNDGTNRYAGLFRDASDSGKFKLFRGLTVLPTTSINTAHASYQTANLVVGQLEGTVATPVQNLITELGTLTALTVGGTSTLRNIVPDSDATRNIGAVGNNFANLYLSGTGFIPTLVSSTSATVSNLQASGSVFLNATVQTDANLTRDIGTSSFGFRDIYNRTIYLQNGSAATPAISFTSDSGNGLYLSAADELSLATNSTQRLRLSTTELVSSLPLTVNQGASKSKIASTSAGNGRLIIEEKTVNANPGLEIWSDAITPILRAGLFFNNTNNSVELWNASGHFLRYLNASTELQSTNNFYAPRIRLPEGTSTPALYFDGDSGIRQASDGDLRFMCDNVETLRMRSSGLDTALSLTSTSTISGTTVTGSTRVRVGSGFRNLQLLEVCGSVAGGEVGLRLDNASATGYTVIRFAEVDGSGQKYIHSFNGTYVDTTGAFRRTSLNLWNTGGPITIGCDGTTNPIEFYQNGTGSRRVFIDNNSLTLENSTVIRAIDGSASSPAYTFDANRNTGFYRVTTDTIGASTSGSVRMTINNDTVLINTTTTDTKFRLNVNGDVSFGKSMGQLIWSNSETLSTSATPYTFQTLTGHDSEYSNGHITIQTGSVIRVSCKGVYVVALRVVLHASSGFVSAASIFRGSTEIGETRAATGHFTTGSNGTVTLSSHSFLLPKNDDTDEDFTLRIANSHSSSQTLTITHAGFSIYRM